MQDTLLRVFVVALSLLVYPKDDPSVEQWEDNIIAGRQKAKQERLQRGGDTLDHEMAPFMTHADDEEPQDGVKVNTKEQTQPVSDDVNVFKQEEDCHKLTHLDPSCPKKSKMEPENALQTSEIDQEQITEEIQTGVPFRSASRSQGQQKTHDDEEVVNSGEESPLSQLHTRTSGEESSKPGISNWESDYLWYIWNIFSIISMIRLFWKYLGRGLQNKQAQTQPLSVTCTAAEVLLPDSDTLHRFHSKCIQVLSDEKVWEDTFLEGFAHDLVDAMKTICEKSYGMVIEDFQMVDVCDIIVPINPPDPRRFQCLLGNNQGSDLLPDAQVYGRIKLVENRVLNGCPCQSSDTDDMLCLLHCETENVGKKTDVCVSLCVNSFLSKTQVTRWFLNTIKQAWALISHMYGFELIIRYIHAPGTLVVRFRSGKKIIFTMKPVVKFNTDSFFSVTPCTPSSLDTFWTLSLANYEDSFLKQISKRLPEHSCHSQTLEIAYFLHRRQTALSGSSTLKDFHFKAALMHQLLTKNPLEWKPNYLACRLRDLLDFMEKSLERKLLRHVLIGNPLTQKVIELPAEFMQADPVNLFHPLVVHKCMHRSAVMHFQEILRNTHMLISDYVNQCTRT